MPQELRFENEFFLVFPTIFRVRLKFLLSLTKSNNFPRLSYSFYNHKNMWFNEHWKYNQIVSRKKYR